MRLEMMGGKDRYLFAIRRLPRKPLEGVKIGKNCSIGLEVLVGDGTIIEDNVVIRGRVRIGNYCHIKSGSVIGSKGFSFGFDETGLPIPMYHMGGVVIGDCVEVGSLCTVCQATLQEADTILENHVKLDDHIHIAHNCYIQEGAILTAGVQLGGGARIGKQTWIGLNATINNKVRIGDYALVGSGAVVIHNVPEYGVAVGNPAKIIRQRGAIREND